MWRWFTWGSAAELPSQEGTTVSVPWETKGRRPNPRIHKEITQRKDARGNFMRSFLTMPPSISSPSKNLWTIDGQIYHPRSGFSSRIFSPDLSKWLHLPCNNLNSHKLSVIHCIRPTRRLFKPTTTKMFRSDKKRPISSLQAKGLRYSRYGTDKSRVPCAKSREGPRVSCARDPPWPLMPIRFSYIRCAGKRVRGLRKTSPFSTLLCPTRHPIKPSAFAYSTIRHMFASGEISIFKTTSLFWRPRLSGYFIVEHCFVNSQRVTTPAASIRVNSIFLCPPGILVSCQFDLTRFV